MSIGIQVIKDQNYNQRFFNTVENVCKYHKTQFFTVFKLLQKICRPS